MGYQRSDYRYGGDDRWQDRDRDRSRSYGRGYDRGYDARDDDRGFFDRAGDEVRSWFGDEEAERRREMDERRWAREHAADRGGWSTGGGWGNQRGDSWRRDRPGERGYLREGGWTDEEIFGANRSGGGASGFGGAPDSGRRFDRIDAGSTGTHGVHPMSSPVGGAYGADYGASASGYGSSAARYGARSGGRGGGLHDPHYSEWRNRQIDDLDRDYDEYRREHQSKFEQEFGNWRNRRRTQRQSLGQVTEHMEVVGSDGERIGTVDKVRGDRIILTKSDENAGGAHHSIPCSWIESVDDKVKVDKTAQEAMDAWRNEERSRALFEREDSGSDGPHVLNRSFSGTY
ncbi:DUF2171 domain-containing protein [Sphingosinicella rhizophila]|uniref:DUF2171 domain-containing protein n=1 Tax=Sphingosinicella rhizophila TaxID=3050082 RepID=A0ABU3Q414_9SPHN|nr:DUF2171 domain-containing protein [Sphingosinicella sp. GR2756]MDT9598163.1 DUF2171 domain-containing protein [Sphingosinicella sp. GR2756]